ncbi:MAG TPA: histidinol-phosphatase, partial [bacterium]|nr:histidinol-phosphatase [bacterium]
MENKDIAKVFDRIGKLLEIKGENVFKIRAYYNAARTIAGLPISLKEAAAIGTIKNIKGIGGALEKKILELIATGKLEYLERIEAEIPAEIIEMLKIPGLGPRKIHKLVDILGIKTIGELEYACRENRLKNIDGFGVKSQENVLKGIELIKHFRGRILYDEAESLADEIVS